MNKMKKLKSKLVNGYLTTSDLPLKMAVITKYLSPFVTGQSVLSQIFGEV
jgi:hypothetical protein